jgi:thiazole synthase
MSLSNIMPTAPAPDPLVIYGQSFSSRLLLGTSRYPSPATLEAAVRLAQPAMLTASLRRQNIAPTDAANADNSFWNLLRQLKVPVLPNTAGCHSIQEVFTTAQMAREVFETPWIKLELIGDDYTLQPDTLNLVEAASRLIKDGFKVLPYCTEDLVLCQRLVDVGCQAVMPWAAPIGTGKGPINPYAMRVLRERLAVPMIVDAGLGLPSHACQVMEWGFDAVLLNTAVALAQDPVEMADAFSKAVQAGRKAFRAGAMAEQHSAQASTPVLGTPFWHQA